MVAHLDCFRTPSLSVSNCCVCINLCRFIVSERLKNSRKNDVHQSAPSLSACRLLQTRNLSLSEVSLDTPHGGLDLRPALDVNVRLLAGTQRQAHLIDQVYAPTSVPNPHPEPHLSLRMLEPISNTTTDARNRCVRLRARSMR